MAPEVEGAARKPQNSTFASNSLEYNYDAELAAVVPSNVKIPFDNIAGARRVEPEGMAEELQAQVELPKGPSVFVKDHVLPGTGGSSDLPIRIYTPAGRTTSRGVLAFFHDGGARRLGRCPAAFRCRSSCRRCPHSVPRFHRGHAPSSCF